MEDFRNLLTIKPKKPSKKNFLFQLDENSEFLPKNKD